MSEPRLLTDYDDRLRARQIRDWHWEVMEQMAAAGTLHVCLWNKLRLDPLPNEIRLCLISGMELMEWISRHQAWFTVGECSADRHVIPMGLTEAGDAALRDRGLYDLEPVYGGLVEPGWQAIPLPAREPAGARDG